MHRSLIIWLSATSAFAVIGVALGLFAVLAPRAPLPVSPPASLPQALEQATVGILDRNDALILIRSTIVALHQANQTANYVILRELGAPGFGSNTNPPERLAEIFADLRNNRYDLSAVVVLEPRFLIPPRLEGNGLLRMAGFFPSMPLQVNFDLLFAPIDNRWRLFGVAINVGPSGPGAPRSDAQPPTPPNIPPAVGMPGLSAIPSTR